MKFRIWCYDYNCWEKDDIFLSKDGDLFMIKNGMPMGKVFIKPDRHKLEIETGFKDKNGESLFVGDIIRYEDGNCGYGRLRDHYLDGYIYEVISDNYIIQLTENLYNDDLVTTFEKVGNIHETELTDEMRYWIDIEFRKKFQKEHGKEGAVW